MPVYQKHFTLAEARAMVPQLRRLFKELHARRERTSQADKQLGTSLTQTGGDVGGEVVAAMLADLATLNAEVWQLQERGVLIKDFDRGLVDFPSFREGREVFLCWELAEDDIEFFHEIDTGYPGRERL